MLLKHILYKPVIGTKTASIYFVLFNLRIPKFNIVCINRFKMDCYFISVSKWVISIWTSNTTLPEDAILSSIPIKLWLISSFISFKSVAASINSASLPTKIWSRIFSFPLRKKYKNYVYSYHTLIFIFVFCLCRYI